MADTMGTSWSDIPLDLASRILHRLPAHVDRVRFAAVCPQWRAATQHGHLPPPLPLLLLSDGKVYSLPGSQRFHFPGFTGCIDAACGDWLVFSGEDGYFLRDPLSNATVTLPPLSRVRTRLDGTDGGPVWSQAPSTAPATMKCLPRTFTCRGRDGGVLNAELAWLEMAKTLKLQEPKSCKVWFCSNSLIVATINFWGGKRIAVCQPGAASWWSVRGSNLVDMARSEIVDMAFHQGKLYAIDCMATLFAIDVSVDHSSGDPWISQIQRVIMPVFGFERSPHLVESRGVLLAVFRNWRPHLNEGDAAEFWVLEADLSQSKWFKLTAIGDNEVLFLSRGCSRSVCVSHNALPGGCIFFLDNEYKDDNYNDFFEFSPGGRRSPPELYSSAQNG